MSMANDLSDSPRIQQKRESLRGWWTGKSDVEAVAVDIELEAGVAADWAPCFFLLPAIATNPEGKPKGRSMWA